jgi:hypothetical protein
VVVWLVGCSFLVLLCLHFVHIAGGRMWLFIFLVPVLIGRHPFCGGVRTDHQSKRSLVIGHRLTCDIRQICTYFHKFISPSAKRETGILFCHRSHYQLYPRPYGFIITGVGITIISSSINIVIVFADAPRLNFYHRITQQRRRWLFTTTTTTTNTTAVLRHGPSPLFR